VARDGQTVIEVAIATAPSRKKQSKRAAGGTMWWLMLGL